MDDNTNSKPSESSGSMDDIKSPTPDPTSRPIIQNQDVQSDPMVNEAISAGVSVESSADAQATPGGASSAFTAVPDASGTPSMEDLATPPAPVGDPTPLAVTDTPPSDNQPTEPVTTPPTSSPTSSFTASTPPTDSTNPQVPPAAAQPGAPANKTSTTRMIIYVGIAIVLIVVIAIVALHK